MASCLSDDPYWPTLAAAIDRAATAGYDVTTALPALIAAAPLPDDHVARAVHYRLANDCPNAQIPEHQRLRNAIQREDETAAGTGMATGEHLPNKQVAWLTTAPDRGQTPPPPRPIPAEPNGIRH